MNKETIEKAAKEYASRHSDGFKPETGLEEEIFNAFRQASMKPFVDGAQWRINAVWHDTSEIPKEGEHIVIVMENRCFTSWFVISDIAMMFKKLNAVLWAYSRDLLPEGNSKRTGGGRHG